MNDFMTPPYIQNRNMSLYYARFSKWGELPSAPGVLEHTRGRAWKLAPLIRLPLIVTGHYWQKSFAFNREPTTVTPRKIIVMKTEAIHLVGPRKAELREVEVADPKPHEVQVLCKASGICQSSVAVFTEAEKHPYPCVPGHEGVGQVIRTGSEVKDIVPGEYVTCYRWQKIQNVDARHAHKIPGEPEDPALWMVAPVACAISALRHCDVRPGDRAVVIGAGFMGLLLVQLLGRSPVYELVALDVKPRNLELALQFGATETIHCRTPDGEARLKTIEQNPFDLAIEAAGVQQTLDLGAKLTRRGGRYCIFARHSGQRQADLGAWYLQGLKVFNFTPATDHAADSGSNFERAVRCMW
ncbi:MAG: zinc-binding dehydrogenase, partial [Verrucomicrobia bacterium]|nr:zinc-binding dehydrogenase [Verrucomicrobiota bacterium]